jgi:hypothetical protein
VRPMTVKRFADDAGVTFHRCGRDWGGTWGYSSKDHPNSQCNGYDTKAEALDAWGGSTFGDRAWAAVKSLMNADHATAVTSNGAP